jgi:hypothetical protein
MTNAKPNRVLRIERVGILCPVDITDMTTSCERSVERFISLRNDVVHARSGWGCTFSNTCQNTVW